ncbi:MAG: nucleotidyltransferase family protein [Thermodesulfobacteriota bacterium]
MEINNLLRDKREEIIRIAAKHGARNVRVFGSVAGGDSTPESDVDLLVAFDPGTSLFDHSALVRELTKLLGKEVQVVSERALRARVRERVMKDAVPL